MNHYLKWIFSSNCLLFICFNLLQFSLNAQTADLIIQKTGPTSVKEGLPMSYTIKISNNGPTAVTNATFNDTFPANVSGVHLRTCTELGSAICPNTSQYTISKFYVIPDSFTVFKGTIPSLPLNSSITFTIDLNAPPYKNVSSISNTATVKVPTGISDPDLSTNSSTWNTVLIDTVPIIINPTFPKGDIAVFKTVDDTRGYDCTSYPKTYRYKVSWINKGPIDFHNIVIEDVLYSINTTLSGFNYPWKITDTLWKSSPGSNLISNYQTPDTGFHRPVEGIKAGIIGFAKLIPVFQKGDTITFSYTFTILKPTGPSCGGSIAWDLLNEVTFRPYYFFSEIDSFPSNNYMAVKSSVMTCSVPRTNFTNDNVHVKITKTVSDTSSYTIDSIPKSYTYTVRWINDGANNITDLSISDAMIASLVSSSGLGFATYQYPWTISNLTWKTSQGSSVVVIVPFVLSGTFYLGNNITACYASVPLLEKGDTVSFTYTLTIGSPIITGAGYNIKWKLENEATYSYFGCNPKDSGVAISNGIYGYSPEIKKTDLKVTNTVDNTQSYVCQKETKILKYKIQWVNGGPTDVVNANIYDYLYTSPIYTTISYRWNISNVVWSSSSGVIVPTDTFSTVSGIIPGPISYCYFLVCPPFTYIQSKILKFKVGDTISLSYTFTLQPPNEIGCGGILNWQLQNTADIPWNNNYYIVDTFLNNNSSYVSNSFTETSTDLVISTTVNPAIVDNDDILTISNEFYNAANAYSKPAIWFDTLPETFRINMNSITCSRLNGTSSCGRITYDSVTRILRQEIDSMPANSGVKVTFKGTVNSLYTVTEYNKVFAYNSCLDCVPATNFTQSNYQINGQCDSVFAGVDGDTAVFDNYRDTIFLFNLLKGKPQSKGTWIRTDGTGGTFNAALGTFIVSSTTTTSTFMYVLPGNAPCPADTSYVIVSIIPSPLPDTSKTNVPVKSTVKICDFVPVDIVNTTVSLCDSPTIFSSTHGSWSIDSITKCLVYTSTNIKGTDSICLDVCNKRTQICKETNIIITISGVPPIAVSDTTIKTTANTPVIIPVLANDTSKDNDVLQFCNPAIYIQPSHGTITVNQNGTITYTPANAYEGIDSFQYIICDADGSDTAWVRVTISCNDNEMCCDIPNAFSPNNDGVNDVFIARCGCPVEEFYLLIYDRWGNKIFESFDINIGWNGIYKNKRAQVEAYGYYMEYRPTCSSNKVIKKGNVTLVE